MQNVKVEQMHESVMSLLGKNLFHCKDTNCMFWCDILGGQVFMMDLNNKNKLHMFRLMGENTISFCIPMHGKKHQYMVGAGKRLLLVTWDGMGVMGQITKVLCEVPINGVRINQCKVDKMGRLYFGTMVSEDQGDQMNLQKRMGGLYCFTMTGGLMMMKDNVGMGNGMCWNNTWTKMYFADSFDMSICEFDYDMKTGTLTNQKVFLDISNLGQVKKVFPSGMTMDSDDHIFLTMFGGGKVVKINTKTKKMEGEIMMPVQQVTGVEFGGQNFETMFVTTAGMGMLGAGHEAMQTYPSGFLMKVTNTGCKGVHMHKFMTN